MKGCGIIGLVGGEFTAAWFRQQLENIISDLGSRYSPELNVHLEVRKKFEYLRRSPEAYSKIQKVKKEFQRKGSDFIKEIPSIKECCNQNSNEYKNFLDALA